MGYQYVTKVFCLNCGFEGNVKILKGFSVKEKRCLRCECATLKPSALVKMVIDAEAKTKP